MTPVSIAKYRQTFAFDAIGNMINKLSTTNIPGSQGNSYPKAELDYNLDYEYDPAYAHRLVKAGTRYYRYDANGNITAEKDGPFTDEEEFTFTYSYFENEDVYGTDYGFGLDAPKETEQANPQDLFAYRRNYTWNERNLLTKSSDRNFTVHYRYGEDGQRALKYTDEGRSETLYFNNFFTIHIPTQDQNNPQGLRVHKHIFVGNSRLVTAMTHTDNSGDNEEQKAKQYYYHSDHLGSAQFVTDWHGRQYEHIEYTPYGELWIEEVAAGLDKLPFRFTGKELDEETGLYYYGARYLDPKYSRWLSGDPALNDYIPQAPVNDEAKKHNENLPGMGGVFNTVNLHVYHYAGNNPVKYTDPDGRDIIYKDDDGNIEKIESSSRNEIHTPASDRELLEENAKEMKKHALNISYFYKKVKSHGDWDFKNFKEEDGKRGWYWFNGKLVTAEEFGNLHYGYVGAAGGFSTLLLIEAPGIAQVKAGTATAGFWLTNFDDPRDTQNILRGIYAYDGSLGNKITRTIGDHFYLSFCFTSFRMFTFTAFIFENKLKRRK